MAALSHIRLLCQGTYLIASARAFRQCAIQWREPCNRHASPFEGCAPWPQDRNAAMNCYQLWQWQPQLTHKNVKHGNSRHKIRVFSNVSPLMIEIQRRGIPLPLFPFPYMFWSLTSFPHSAFGVSTSLIFTNLVFLESIPSRSASTPQVQTEHTSNIFHPNTIAHAGKYIRLLWFDGILNITPYSYTPKHILYYGWFLHGKLPAIATTALISLGTGSSMLKPSSIMTWQSGWCLGIGWYR